MKDGRDGERMSVTTAFGCEVPADHYCSKAALATGSTAAGLKNSLGFMLLVIFKAVVSSLSPTSFILVVSQYFS